SIRPRPSRCQPTLPCHRLHRLPSRCNSSNTVSRAQKIERTSRPSFWRTARVFGLAAVASGLGYAFGISDSISRLPGFAVRETEPIYGPTKDLKKVCGFRIPVDRNIRLDFKA